MIWIVESGDEALKREEKLIKARTTKNAWIATPLDFNCRVFILDLSNQDHTAIIFLPD